MKTVNTTGLMLGMLAVGGLIAVGAMFTGRAFAQSSEQTATVGQANVNTDKSTLISRSFLRFSNQWLNKATAPPETRAPTSRR